jgi:hypothetical protein
LLARISNTALLKSQAWANQLNTYATPNTEAEVSLLRLLLRAKDELVEIHGLVSALEGAVDSEESATTSILKKTLEQSKINNEIQQVGQQNPARAREIQSDQNVEVEP